MRKITVFHKKLQAAIILEEWTSGYNVERGSQ